MTVEDLMKPRYKVIAVFPRCWHSIGKILNADKDGYFEIWQDEFMDIHYIDAFPHLFRKLEWYEERAIEDMPEYVKLFYDYGDKIPYLVAKVEKWDIEKYWAYFSERDRKVASFNGLLQPATLTEYLTYNKQL